MKGVLFWIFLLGRVCALESTIEERIARIPLKDRERISYFFQHAVFWDFFGYVLLGDKPCAISSYAKITSVPSSWISYFIPHNLKMKNGWQTWLKYEQWFPHPSFIFVEEEFSSTSSHFIFLIHRDKTLQKIREHLKDFQAILHADVQGEELLSRAQKGAFFSQVLKGHDGLMGTLLGFGRNNAWLYQEKSPKLHPFPGKDEQEQMQDFCQSQGSWKFFTGSFSKDFQRLPLPCFVADPHDPETKVLKRVYTKNRQKILFHYKEKDFLEETLRLLCDVTPKN